MDYRALKEHLEAQSIDNIVASYVKGRGATEDIIRSLGIVTWRTRKEPFADKLTRKMFGARGERMDGWLILPLRSPRGSLVGFQARCLKERRFENIVFANNGWNPFWIGMPGAMTLVWSEADVWLCEGLFDYIPLRRVVPGGHAVLGALTANVSIRQLEFLRRFSPRMVHLVLDQDEAGRIGANKVGTFLSEVNVPYRVVPYMGGKDPGALWDLYGLDMKNHMGL